MEIDNEVQVVSVGEGVSVVELRVEHLHIASRAVETCHRAIGGEGGEVIAVEGAGIEAFATVEGTIVVGREAAVVVVSFHHHARQREVVLLRGMQGDAGTTEEVVAAIGSLATIPLELIGLCE